VRVVEVRERAVDISRYSDPAIPSGGLNTSIVAVVTDAVRHGRPVVGFGFSSMGRFAQSGLIRERFVPRLLAAGDVDPMSAWAAMMKGEKPGGHGERCVAVGTLDMALWDAAAKIADLPLHDLLKQQFGEQQAVPDVPVYASGGYLYPDNDLARLADELRAFRDRGYTRAKIKIGASALSTDLKRIEAALELFDERRTLAVDAIYAYDARTGPQTAAALRDFGLMWFEDICDPLDLETWSAVAASYPEPIAAGEALFSATEARLLDRHAGLRRQQDILLFDPVHCYGLPGYLQIIEAMEQRGWSRTAFWPHGGHLFCLHLASALGLGGVEVNPSSFPPFGGLIDDARIAGGRVAPPDLPGIGFEGRAPIHHLFKSLLES
jgi:L-alanine-DL-glutamate epimerase-like enolase superfamily enzyme